MTSHLRRGTPRLGLVALLALGAVTATESSEQRGRWELHGACYCRVAGELTCLAETTESQCRRRCADELCDDWFWLERRPCWSWGYGG